MQSCVRVRVIIQGIQDAEFSTFKSSTFPWRARLNSPPLCSDLCVNVVSKFGQPVWLDGSHFLHLKPAARALLHLPEHQPLRPCARQHRRYMYPQLGWRPCTHGKPFVGKVIDKTIAVTPGKFQGLSCHVQLALPHLLQCCRAAPRLLGL